MEYIQNLNPKQENQTMNFHSKDGDPSPQCLMTTATPSGTSPGSQRSRTASEIEMKKFNWKIQNLNPRQENQTMNFHSKDGDPSPPCLTTTATPSGTSPGSQHSRTASEIEMKKQKLEYTKFEPKARKPNDEFPLKGWRASPPCLTTTATPSGTSPGSQRSRTASEIRKK
jgi:hypothetical protein